MTPHFIFFYQIIVSIKRIGTLILKILNLIYFRVVLSSEEVKNRLSLKTNGRYYLAKQNVFANEKR